jgi:hypothetical protein
MGLIVANIGNFCDRFPTLKAIPDIYSVQKV